MEMVVGMNNLKLFLSKISDCHCCCYWWPCYSTASQFVVTSIGEHDLKIKHVYFFNPRLLSGQTTSFLCIEKLPSITWSTFIWESVLKFKLKTRKRLRAIAILSDYSLMIKKPGGCLVSQPVQFVLDSFRHISQFLLLVANCFLSLTKCFIYHS